MRPTRRAAAAGLAASFASPALAAPVRRVASINPCLDAILVRVCDRAQIAALSHYSRDRVTSSIADIAATYPVNYGSAEEIAALRPDIVFVGFRASVTVNAALTRLGVRTALYPVPETVADSFAQVVEIARLVGHAGRGEALVRRIEAAIAAASPPAGARPISALVYQASGLASGPGTLVDEMLHRAGFVNAARRYGMNRTGMVPLEKLVADPPQVLLAGAPRPGAPTWADRVLRHPALAAVAGRMHRASFPQRLIYCGGPSLIETAAVLARAHREASA